MLALAAFAMPTPFARVLLVLAMALVSAGAHAVVVGWALASFPRLRRHRRPILACVAILIVALPSTRWAAMRTHGDLALTLHAFGMVELLVVGLALVPIAVLRVGLWLAYRRRKPKAAPAADLPAAAQTAGIGRRQAIERVVGLGALGSSVAACGWGMRARHIFEVEEVTVRIPGLPRALEGYTLAQISDIHIGLFVGDRELAEGLSRVRDVGADMLLVTGDLVDMDARHAPRLARALADASPRDGVVAILGNHDYYAGASIVTDAMRAAGIEMLVNAGKTVRPGDGGGFALLGVDDLWGKARGGPGPLLDRAAAMVPSDLPRVLLAHQPFYFRTAAGKVALQLSGHTHGGQINPGINMASFVSHYVAGRYERNGSTLWVNRGFGVVGAPVRIGAPPEVSKIVLVGA